MVGSKELLLISCICCLISTHGLKLMTSAPKFSTKRNVFPLDFSGFDQNTMVTVDMGTMLMANEISDAYTQFMQNNGLVADMATVFVSNGVSDSLAQFTEANRESNGGTDTETGVPDTEEPKEKKDFFLDFDRMKRFAIFGFFDGAVGHYWFVGLDNVIRGTDGLSVVYKIVADTLVFTPLWCVWFILGMSILEGNLQEKFVKNLLPKEWQELLYIDVGFFLPLSTVVYSVVPREARVLVFSIANLVYTSIVSLWNQKKREEIASAAVE